jgi:4-hydroxybenzoate polyprenyltransferase
VNPDPKAQSVADAARANWVDRFAPHPWKPYLRLARADRPIGTWLLFIPCLWGLALAGGSEDWGTTVLYTLLFGVGSWVMRGAGCTYNDIVDRDFDAQVERTKSRPIPSGQVSARSAALFMIALSLVGFLVLMTFNGYTILLGFSSLALIAAYPFMKRVTYWPQIWLGLTFNWGALVGWSAVESSLSTAPLLLYGGAIFWTIGYDTIYAHQDKEDDLMVGVKSSALKLGKTSKFWIGIFYGITVGMFAGAGLVADLGVLYLFGLTLGAVHLLRQIKNVNIDDPDLCLATFKSNRDFGFIVLAAIVAGHFL